MYLGSLRINHPNFTSSQEQSCRLNVESVGQYEDRDGKIALPPRIKPRLGFHAQTMKRLSEIRWAESIRWIRCTAWSGRYDMTLDGILNQTRGALKP
jgi:hypothetical protein